MFARFKSGHDQAQFSKSPFHKDDRILRFILGRFLGVGLETSIRFQKPQGNDGPREAWERRACHVHQRKHGGHTINSLVMGEVQYGRPSMTFPGELNTACELTCAGEGGEALPSPLGDPLFLPCARAVSPRPTFGVCRLTAATPQLV